MDSPVSSQYDISLASGDLLTLAGTNNNCVRSHGNETINVGTQITKETQDEVKGENSKSLSNCHLHFDHIASLQRVVGIILSRGKVTDTIVDRQTCGKRDTLLQFLLLFVYLGVEGDERGRNLLIDLSSLLLTVG